MKYNNFLFEDFATFKYGKMPKKEKMLDSEGFPIFSGYRISGYYDEYNLDSGELIVVARGVGGTGDVKLSPEKCFLTNLSIAVQVDEKIALKRYLYYYFALNNLRYLDSGSAQSQITIKDLSNIKILLPEVSIQTKVVKILTDIDIKIEINNKINDNLEQQAIAIYQQMFLDNTQSEWSNGVLSDIANITMGQSPSGSSFNEDGIGTIFFQGRAEFGNRFPSVRLYTTEPKRMACKNDILMSVRAPVGDINIAHDDCCIGRGLGAIQSKYSYQSFVLYTMFSLKKQLDVFNGEGTVFGSINRDSLNSMPIVIPTNDKIDEFESIVAPMDAVIRNNYDEICRLQQIRDVLLPKLMSGELDISDINI